MIRRLIRRIFTRYVEETVPKISKPPFVPKYLTRDTKIIDALDSSLQAGEIFAKRRLLACHLCPLKTEETLGEAAQNYGIDEEKWILELNFAIFCRIQEMY